MGGGEGNLLGPLGFLSSCWCGEFKTDSWSFSSELREGNGGEWQPRSCLHWIPAAVHPGEGVPETGASSSEQAQHRGTPNGRAGEESSGEGGEAAAGSPFPTGLSGERGQVTLSLLPPTPRPRNILAYTEFPGIAGRGRQLREKSLGVGNRAWTF